MRRILAVSVVVFLALALVLTSCAKSEKKVVAKVGKISITIDELNKVFGDRPYASFDEELKKKKERLDMIINERLYLAAAYDNALDKDTAIVQAVERDKRSFLMNALYEKVVVEVVKVTPEEIKAYNDALGEEISAKHILVDKKELADSIYNLLQKDTSDANFTKLASQFSTDPGTKDKGGDLGYFKRGRMVREFEDAAFALKVGEISKPVKSPFGYHIIKLTDRRPVQQPPLDDARKAELEKELRMRKERERAQAFVDSLKNACEFKIAEGFKTIQPKLSAENPLTLAAGEDSIVIATYKYGKLTGADLKRVWDYMPPARKSEVVANPEANLRDLMFNEIQTTLLEKAAADLKIEETPIYKERYKTALEQEMVRAFKDKFIYANIQVTPEEVQNYYDTHPNEFIAEPKVQVKEIQLATKQEAEKILKQAKSGNFEKLADKYTLRTYTKGRGGDLGLFPRARFPELFDAAQNLKEGQIAGPIEMGGRYSIIKLVKKEPETKRPFEEVKRMIENKLRMEKRKSAEEAWLNEARKKYKIKINEKVLRESINAKKYEKQAPAPAPAPGK